MNHLDRDLVQALLKAGTLRASTQMARLVRALCARHGVDLAHVGAHLRLEMPLFQPLVIETIGPAHVSVAHYFVENYDLVADPEIVFWTGLGDEQWVPTEVTMAIDRELRVYVQATEKGGVRCDSVLQQDLAKFANQWSTIIRRQGWLEHGINPNSLKPWQIRPALWRAMPHKVRRIDKQWCYLDDRQTPWPGVRTKAEVIDKQHKLYVREAILAGEQVPAAVLADYPDLALAAACDVKVAA